MGTLNSWAVIDANNNAAPPDGWPENTMNYSDVNNTGRAVQGTIKRFFEDINGSLDAGGVADAYTLTLNETGYAAYFDGMMFSCSIPVTNATTSPTIDVNGIGAVNIIDRNGNVVGAGELQGGGVYDFRHDGTNVRLIGSGGVGGSSTQVQYNFSGVQAGASGLTYNNVSDEMTAVNPANFTVDLVLSEQADHTATPGAGIGLIWLRDDGNLIYTNPSGVDVAIGTTGSSLPGGLSGELQWNNGGSFDGIAEVTWIDGSNTLDFADTSEIHMHNTSGGIGIQFDNQVGIKFGDDLARDCVVRYNESAGAAGALTMDFGTIGGEIRILDNGFSRSVLPKTGGIQFTSDSLLSSDANTLDDYEEGTFTAALNTFGGSITLLSSEDTLAYTKIGNMVHITGRLRVDSVSAPSGGCEITGLPFTVASLPEISDAACCQLVFDANGGGGGAWTQGPIGILVTGTSVIDIQDFDGTDLLPNTAARFGGAGNLLWVNCTYFTDQQGA